MDNFLTFAHTLADSAGAIIRPYFGSALQVELKADESPVSRADREAEAAIRALIQKEFPTHHIYGEEYGHRVASHGEPPRSDRGMGAMSPSNNYTWVIDPIDGTRAFLAGKKEWGTLIALCENGTPILGILDQPVTKERWVGLVGKRTYYLDHTNELATTSSASLAKARLSTTSRNYFTPPQASAFVALAEASAETIENGDCYAYGLLARGMRELVVDAGLKPYDILALVPIIEGAGGTITGWDGAPITLTHYATALAAASAELHQEALAILGRSV